MWVDPIVAETRKAREEHAARFNYDMDTIYRDLKEQEQRDKHKVVSLPPKQPMHRRGVRSESTPQ